MAFIVISTATHDEIPIPNIIKFPKLVLFKNIIVKISAISPKIDENNTILVLPVPTINPYNKYLTGDNICGIPTTDKYITAVDITASDVTNTLQKCFGNTNTTKIIRIVGNVMIFKPSFITFTVS